MDWPPPVGSNQSIALLILNWLIFPVSKALNVCNTVPNCINPKLLVVPSVLMIPASGELGLNPSTVGGCTTFPDNIPGVGSWPDNIPGVSKGNPSTAELGDKNENSNGLKAAIPLNGSRICALTVLEFASAVVPMSITVIAATTMNRYLLFI